MIEKMIKENDEEGLRRISQINCLNAFYSLRFGSHNNYGIHGATPMEALHWIYLNYFGHTRENLFFQAGPKSALANTINTTATAIGQMLGRQSDKDMPRTIFSAGVQDGKVMAHEMAGIMILLLLTFRSARGRKALLNESHGEKQANFSSLMDVCSWLSLLEIQLQFERWMHKDEFSVELLRDRCLHKCVRSWG